MCPSVVDVVVVVVELQELEQKRAQRAAEVQHAAEAELESLSTEAGCRKPPRISPASTSNNSPMSPTDVKAKNTGQCEQVNRPNLV